jgi:hypothetical protein
MMKLISSRKIISLLLFELALFSIACSSPANVKKDSALNANSRSPANSPTNQTASTAKGFSKDQVCNLPKAVGGSSALAELGGGTWGKWGDSGGDNDYGCNGGKDSVKLEQQTAKISASYGAFGDVDTLHSVFAKYLALQYGGKTPVEGDLRRQYIDFCDGLAAKFYGQKLSENFKKRLIDESTYSSSDAAGRYSEKIGDGYIDLAAKKEKEVMFTLEVRFFANEADYKKYKDS